MDNAHIEVPVADTSIDTSEVRTESLSDIELALVGGGIGNTIL